MKIIAKLLNHQKFQVEGAETQLAEFDYKECSHERRGVRYPPMIKTPMDWADQSIYEFCKDCGEVTRVGKY